jgi:predicted DNA-binding transcriptional regulator YafY
VLPAINSSPCASSQEATMFREVRVFEIREVLRLWMRNEGLRGVERLAGVDRKTVRRYVAAAEELGLARGGGEAQLAKRRAHRLGGRGGAPPSP